MNKKIEPTNPSMNLAQRSRARKKCNKFPWIHVALLHRRNGFTNEIKEKTEDNYVLDNNRQPEGMAIEFIKLLTYG